MCGYGHQLGGLPEQRIRHAPLTRRLPSAGIGVGVAGRLPARNEGRLGEEQGACDDKHLTKITHARLDECLKAGPVVAVESGANLRADVGEAEGLIEHALRPAVRGGGCEVPPIVSAAPKVLQVVPKRIRDGVVLDELAAFAVALRSRHARLGEAFDRVQRVAGPRIEKGHVVLELAEHASHGHAEPQGGVVCGIRRVG